MYTYMMIHEPGHTLTCLLVGLVAHYPHGPAIKSCKTHHYIASKVRHDFKEVTLVHHLHTMSCICTCKQCIYIKTLTSRKESKVVQIISQGKEYCYLRWDLNLRPLGFRLSALPTELQLAEFTNQHKGTRFNK